jgi:hypothetical protein
VRSSGSKPAGAAQRVVNALRAACRAPRAALHVATLTACVAALGIHSAAKRSAAGCEWPKPKPHAHAHAHLPAVIVAKPDDVRGSHVVAVHVERSLVVLVHLLPSPWPPLPCSALCRQRMHARSHALAGAWGASERDCGGTGRVGYEYVLYTVPWGYEGTAECLDAREAEVRHIRAREAAQQRRQPRPLHRARVKARPVARRMHSSRSRAPLAAVARAALHRAGGRGALRAAERRSAHVSGGSGVRTAGRGNSPNKPTDAAARRRDSHSQRMRRRSAHARTHARMHAAEAVDLHGVLRGADAAGTARKDAESEAVPAGGVVQSFSRLVGLRVGWAADAVGHVCRVVCCTPVAGVSRVADCHYSRCRLSV